MQICVRVYLARSSVFCSVCFTRFHIFVYSQTHFFYFFGHFVVRVYLAFECIWRRSNVFGGRSSVFGRVRVYLAPAKYTPMDLGTVRVYSAKCASVFGGFECIWRASVFGEAALQKNILFTRFSRSPKITVLQNEKSALRSNVFGGRSSAFGGPFECIWQDPPNTRSGIPPNTLLAEGLGKSREPRPR